jgi:hypothetical protein
MKEKIAMKFKRFIKYIVFLLLSFSCTTMFSGTCNAESSKTVVCKSPHLEVTRYKWEGNNWTHLRDSDSKTFEIEGITFNISLDKTDLTVRANNKKLVDIDEKKYYSDSGYHSKSRKSKFTTSHKVQGKKVMVRILNFAPEPAEKGGFRWCLLEIYVESSQSVCEAAGGTFVGGFPEIPLTEMDYK